jgi:uncharacterized damage-inducible protein DinB
MVATRVQARVSSLMVSKSGSVLQSIELHPISHDKDLRMPTSHRVELARQQMQFARNYTLGLLKDIDDAQWFLQPGGVVTHVAWQVGHLAMAQYGLTMIRVRGKEPEDEALIPADFVRKFQKGTQPEANPASYPSPAEIRNVLQRVHERACEELTRYTDEQLDVKLPEPHAVFDTKLGSVFFCSAHELIHAGQIALLRRLLGKQPLR